MIWLKLNKPDVEPSAGIAFTLLNKTIPEGTREPQSAVELCALLNEMSGLPPPTEEEQKDIDVYCLIAYQSQKAGRSSIDWARRLSYATQIPSYANWIGYVSGSGVILSSGFSGWILGFMLATRYAQGAALMAVQMVRAGDYTERKLLANIAIHIASLLALYVCVVLRLFGKI